MGFFQATKETHELHNFKGTSRKKNRYVPLTDLSGFGGISYSVILVFRPDAPRSAQRQTVAWP